MTHSHASREGHPDFPIVNRVIDSFDVRIWRDHNPSEWLLENIGAMREAVAVWKPEPDTIVLPNLGTFQIRKSRKQVYEIVLYNVLLGDIHIWNPDKWNNKQAAQTGTVYVSLRSVFLQAGSYPAIQSFLERVEKLLFGPVRLYVPEASEPFRRVSRADIAVDYADQTWHRLTEKEQVNHSVITWAEMDLYQARGKRLKREGWFSPFAASTTEVLDTVLRRAGSSWTEMKKKLGIKETRGFDTTNPPAYNRGGHSDIRGDVTAVWPKAIRGSDGKLGASTFDPDLTDLELLSHNCFGPAALAAQAALSLFANMLLESNMEQGAAYVTRVIGARKGPQTIYFGRYDSSLYAREYAKLTSLYTQSKEYMLDVWIREGWDAQAPVWRCEFSCAGEFLQQFIDPSTGERMDLRDPEAFFDHIPQVWGYLTRTWLRHTMPSDDQNRSRWPASNRWRSVQNGWSGEDYLLRLKRPPTPSEAHLKPGSRGYAISQTAIVSAKPEIVAQARALIVTGQPKPRNNLERAEQDRLIRKKILELAKQKVLDGLRHTMFDPDEQMRFDQETIERQASFGLDEFSDAGFSAMLRADRMREGGGS
jgi:hypothetical protein